MASAFSHAVVAVAVGATYVTLQPHIESGTSPVPLSHLSSRFWFLTILCSILPDVDVLGYGLGVPYRSVWGHRGITHSLPFACALGVGVVTLGFPESPRLSAGWWSLVLYFSAVTASHALLDALTNGGLGVALLAPFENSRYFFPWRPIEVSPIGIRAFFTGRGLDVITSEIVWIWIPSAAWMLLWWVLRRGP